MARINVYANDELDGKTLIGHFDPDKAEFIQEDTRWNGNNNVSVHTADQFAHQGLYRTAGGRWVLNLWSQWQGSEDSYEFISDEQARTWLLVNKSDDVVEKYFGEIEEERGPGRPEIGPAFSLRFPTDLLAKVDAAAEAEGVSRAEKIRRLVDAAI